MRIGNEPRRNWDEKINKSIINKSNRSAFLRVHPRLVFEGQHPHLDGTTT